MENSIAMLRKAKGWSSAELARRTGTSRQQMERLEKGYRSLTKEWAEKIAPVLEVTPAELMFPELLREKKQT